MMRLVIATGILLCCVAPALAAEPSNPTTPIAQPQGSPVYWSQFMLRALGTYRIGEPTRLNYLEAASGAAAAGAAATGAASSATAAGPR
jgi:hypothetical protein